MDGERCPNVSFDNFAVGGKNSIWGIESITENLKKVMPDLAVIAFGMNDINFSAEQHVKNVKKMIDVVIQNDAKTNIVVITPMLPNPEAFWFSSRQHAFEEPLLKIENDYDNVVVVPITSMHQSILGYKKYADMTGNNINHPNDFLTRIYVQTILKTMLGNEYDC